MKVSWPGYREQTTLALINARLQVRNSFSVWLCCLLSLLLQQVLCYHIYYYHKTFITNQHLPSAMPSNTQVLKSCRRGILWHHPHTCINHLCIAQALPLMLTKWLEVVGYYFMLNKTRKIRNQQFYSHQICRIDESRIPGNPISICHHGGLSNPKN